LTDLNDNKNFVLDISANTKKFLPVFEEDP